MKYHRFCLLLLIFITHETTLWAQSTQELAVRKVIEDLFEGMKSGDSAAVANLFHPDVRMMTSFTSESGEAVLKEGSLQTFLEAIGTPHSEAWIEKTWDTEVRIDDSLAQVWTDYAFFVGDQFSHCGVDAFQLVRGNDGRWRIIHLIDTRRKKSCDLP